MNNISVLPVSVVDLEKRGKLFIRGDQNHDKQSSRSGFSPFPKEASALAYELFLKDKKLIVDPFAGWGERHAAAKENNKSYHGVDINQEAIDFAQTNFGVTNHKDNSITHDFPEHDGLFTCPPYWNLEKYSDAGLDNVKTWDGFVGCYWAAIFNCMEKAESGAIYVIVTGDWRNKGVYYDLTYQTEKFFDMHNWIPLDKVILSRKNTSKIKIMLPQAKRLGYTVKCHESMLVFKKP